MNAVAAYQYAPFKVTLHMHPAFVTLLQQDLDKAVLAQNQFTIIPSSLLQLATMVMAEIKGDRNG